LETTAYIWGCGQPSLPLFRDGGVATEAARQAALAHGWDPDREGAWAKEITLPAQRYTALLALSEEAPRDRNSLPPASEMPLGPRLTEPWFAGRSVRDFRVSPPHRSGRIRLSPCSPYQFPPPD